MQTLYLERRVSRCLTLSAALALAALPRVSSGGDCPIELGFAGQWNEDNGSLADIWGDGDVAYMGQFFDNKVHFIDVSDPTNPTQILEWTVGAPNQFASAQDVKVANGLLFISLESDPNDGVEIVDVSDPAHPQHLSWIRTPAMSAVHNTFYDSGYLYIANSATPQLAVVDLTQFDPANPPERIEQNLWLISIGNSFVHDMTVQNGVLYACAWNSGLHVFDVSDIANQPPVFLGSSLLADSNSTHAVWPSADGRWAVVTEERPNGPMKLYEIVPNGPGVDVVLRDEVVAPADEAFSVHNPTVIGTRVYASWYQAGAAVYDIDETQGRFVEVATFDTFPGPAGGFDGAWGIYPFLGDDRILVSDMTGGLFVLATQSLVSVSYPEGRVEVVHPINGATLTVALTPLCSQPDPDTARVFVGIDGSFTEIPLTLIGQDLYEAQLPGAPCGSDYSYYVTVDTLDGQTVSDPPDAPATLFDASIISSTEVAFFDNFETDNGWTALTDACPLVPNPTGAWERVDPNPVIVQGPGFEVLIVPDDDFPGGEGTMCYVTGQGTDPLDFDEADVDGGPVRLITPPIAVGGQDVLISYARWYVAVGLQGQPGEPLRVEASGDNGETWVLIEEVPGDTLVFEWIPVEFQLSDFMSPPDTLLLRFSTEDCPDVAITEALIDEVRITRLICEDVDTTPPVVVHDGGASTDPFSGYVDPRRESDNGMALNQGIDTLTIAFSELVRNVGGGDLDASAFSVTSTGAVTPGVSSVDDSGNPEIVVHLDQHLVPGSWYTIIAAVEDTSGNVIANNGDQGPGVDEPDRVDIGFLPADIDQTGMVNPLDLLRFKQLVNDIVQPDAGTIEDFLDINRSGGVNPLDLLSFKQLINGIPPATQVWAGAMLNAPRP